MDYQKLLSECRTESEREGLEQLFRMMIYLRRQIILRNLTLNTSNLTVALLHIK